MAFYKRQLIVNIVSRVLKISIGSLVILACVMSLPILGINEELGAISTATFIAFMTVGLIIAFIVPIVFISIFVGAVLWVVLPDKSDLLVMSDGAIARRAGFLIIVITQVLLFFVCLAVYDVTASFVAMYLGAIPSLLLGLVVYKSTKAAALEVLPDELDGKPKRKPKAEASV